MTLFSWPRNRAFDGFNKTNHYTDKKRPCTTTLKMKKKLSICECLPCLDLVIFLVLNGIKPQAPLLVVPFRQSLHVSGLRLSFLINENNSSQMFSKPFACDKSKNSTCDNSTRVPSHIPIHHDLWKHEPTTQATCPIL